MTNFRVQYFIVLFFNFFGIAYSQSCMDKETYITMTDKYGSAHGQTMYYSYSVRDTIISPENILGASLSEYDFFKNPDIIYNFKNLHWLNLSSSFNQNSFLGLKDLSCLQFIRVDFGNFVSNPEGCCKAPNLKEFS